MPEESMCGAGLKSTNQEVKTLRSIATHILLAVKKIFEGFRSRFDVMLYPPHVRDQRSTRMLRVGCAYRQSPQYLPIMQRVESEHGGSMSDDYNDRYLTQSA
jgi:hypothetical protein